MTILAKWWPMGLVPVFLLLMWLWTGAAGREAVLKHRVKAYEDWAHVVATRARHTDTVYVRDTLTLTRTRRVTDSLLITDTVIRADTVRMLVERERLACDAVIRTCEQRVAQRDTVIWTQDSIIGLLKKKKPFILRLGKPILPFLGGVITGMILTK